MRPRVEQGVEARIVAPYGLVALGVREHRHEARPPYVEEAVLEARREGPGPHLDEHALAARVRQSLAPHEPAEDDVVEEVLAGEVHDRKPRGCRAAAGGGAYKTVVHGREASFERRPIVVEHPRPHVRRRYDDVKPRLPEAPEHGEALLFRLRPVVDGGDPVAVKVDKAPAAQSGAWSSTVSERNRADYGKLPCE
jgi:hypothetical protein